jgi:hypothetical protein
MCVCVCQRYSTGGHEQSPPVDKWLETREQERAHMNMDIEAGHLAATHSTMSTCVGDSWLSALSGCICCVCCVCCVCCAAGRAELGADCAPNGTQGVAAALALVPPAPVQVSLRISESVLLSDIEVLLVPPLPPGEGDGMEWYVKVLVSGGTSAGLAPALIAALALVCAHALFLVRACLCFRAGVLNPSE